MNYNEMEEAIQEAERTIRQLEIRANSFAAFLDRTIYNVNSYQGRKALGNIKRKLRDFDLRTETWKQ